VLDLAIAAAEREGADIVLASDPDADRLAVAIPDPGGWRRLHGDETGALLADFLLEHAPDPRRGLLVTTVASSTLLARMAEATGARFAETLTGFKWIMRAVADHPDHRLLLGYEEALGYAVSDVVRDKDGISAALVMAQLAAEERRAGRTLEQRLDAIAARYGRHATEPVTLQLEGADGLARMRSIMAAVRAQPPAALLGRPVTTVEDLAADGGRLPRSDVLILSAEGARVVIRPSGTEPKLKAYLEVVVDGDRAAATAALAALRAEVAGLLQAS
jgi:phosphomannomutase